MPRVSLPVAPESIDYQAPETPEEFWRRDWEYVRRLVRSLLKQKQEADDVAADIFEKLLARNIPGMYVPGTVSKFTRRRVTWRSFLSNQVALYVRGKSEQVERHLQREPLWCDSAVGEDGTSWLELFGPRQADEYPSMTSDFVPRVRARLSSLPPWEGPPLLDLFEELLAQVHDNGKVSLAFLRRRFRLSQAEAEAALARLREEVSRSDEPPVTVEVAGVTLTAAEAFEAARLLEEATGNQVRPVLARAGHKLAAAGTKWYLAIARAELRQFPELRGEGEAGPAGRVSHVKGAVVHWLRRVGTGEPPGEIELEEPSPAEQLECRLWHLGVRAEDVREILELARAAYSPRPKAKAAVA